MKLSFIQMRKNTVRIGPFFVLQQKKTFFLCIQSVKVNEPLFCDNKKCCNVNNKKKKQQNLHVHENNTTWKKSVDDNNKYYNTWLSINQNEFQMLERKKNQ